MSSMNSRAASSAGPRYLAMILVTLASVPLSGQGPRDPVAATYRAAGSFDFGAFCVEQIPPGSVVDVGPPSLGPYGDRREVTLRFRRGSAQRPRVFLFENTRPEAGVFDACAEAPAHARRILEGNIKEGTIRFQVVEPQGDYGRATTILDGGLDIELSQVSATFGPLYGGSVVPDNVRVQVMNVGRFESNAGSRRDPQDDRLAGKLSVGSYKLQLTNAQLRLPGIDTLVVATLDAIPEGVVFHVDIPSGSLSLAAGGLRSTAPMDLPAGTLEIAGAAVEVADGVVEEVRLIGLSGGSQPRMELHRLALTAPSIAYGEGEGVHVRPTQAISMKQVSGSVDADRTVAALHQGEAAGVSIPAARLRVGAEGRAATLEGACSIELVRLANDLVEGELRIAAPTLPALAPAAPIIGRDLLLRFQGPPAAPQLEGSLDLSALRLGALALSELAAVRSTFSRALGQTAVPFIVVGGPASGAWSLLTPDAAGVALSGSLRDLRLAGVVVMSPEAGGPRLIVEPQGLRVDAAAAVVTRPILFGAPANETTLGASLVLGSIGGFTVAPDGARGTIQLQTDVLAVTGPGLSFGGPAEGRFSIDQPLRFSAGVTLGIELADLAVSLLEGTASIAPLSAVAQGDQPVRFADLALTAPRVTADRLEVTATPAGANVRATNLVFAADRVEHQADPHWQVAGVTPQFPMVEARLGRADTALVLEEASVQDLALSADSGSYRSRDGFVVEGRGAQIKARRLSSQELVDGQIRIESGTLALDVTDAGNRTTGRTAFSGFEVVARGGKDRLTGSGRLHLDNLVLDHDFPVLADKCGDQLRLRASLGVGNVDLQLELRDSELRGQAAVQSLGLRLLDTAARQCEWNDAYTVDVVKSVTDTVCWIPVISEICKEVQRHVKVPVRVPVRWLARVNHLDIPGRIDRVDVDLRGGGGVGFCMHGAEMQPGGIQDLSVTPTFEARGDLGELVKQVHDFTWRLSVGSLQSAVVSSITNIGGVVTSISPVDACN